MIISATDANTKMDKLSRDPGALFFALSPEGFLLIKKGNNIEVCDFCLILNGQYCRRNGLSIDTDMTLNTQGTVLCCHGKGKFIAPCTDGYEYASSKKPLSQDYCLLLSMRFAERIILLIADGYFGKEAFLVTLTDSSSNEHFASSLIKKLTEERYPTIIENLIYSEEVHSNGEEK